MEDSVLVVAYSHVLGGSERILLDWVPALGAGVTVACPDGPVADGVRAAGLPWRPVRRRRLEVRASPADRVRAAGRLVSHATEIARLDRALRPPTIVAWGMPSVVAAALALTLTRSRARLVFVHVDLLPAGPMGVLVARAARRADRVLTLSADAATDLGLPERTTVVHPGVDLDRFTLAPWPEGPRRALISGAIVGWKRPELALEIVALAAERLPDLGLDVLGAPLDAAGGRLLTAMRERAARPDLDGRVRFLGRLEDPRAAVAAAHAVLHCADREPFGLVVPEALALGRPVVAPAAGGPAEVVTPDCGRLYPPGDAVAGAERLVEVLQDPDAARAMGEAGRRRVEAGFSAERARDGFRALVRSAAGR